MGSTSGVGELYQKKDVAQLKDRFNNPNLEMSLMLTTSGKSDVGYLLRYSKSWKGDVEDLLRYSSAGEIFVRDAVGEGKHLTLAEVWEKSAEIAISK
jgi:hypothetical protein